MLPIEDYEMKIHNREQFQSPSIKCGKFRAKVSRARFWVISFYNLAPNSNDPCNLTSRRAIRIARGHDALNVAALSSGHRPIIILACTPDVITETTTAHGNFYARTTATSCRISRACYAIPTQQKESVASASFA